jgi:hypothetical protein
MRSKAPRGDKEACDQLAQFNSKLSRVLFRRLPDPPERAYDIWDEFVSSRDLSFEVLYKELFDFHPEQNRVTRAIGSGISFIRHKLGLPRAAVADRNHVLSASDVLAAGKLQHQCRPSAISSVLGSTPGVGDPLSKSSRLAARITSAAPKSSPRWQCALLSSAS